MNLKKAFVLLTIILLGFYAFAQKNMRLRSVLAYDKDLSDVWGYAATGKEYALVGVYNGLSIVDVTQPDSIREVFFVPGKNSIWRDIKTWNHHAYVTNETGGGLLIVDLSQLPDTITYNNWIADSALSSAHNIWIDENGFAYMWGFNSITGTVNTGDRGAFIADLNSDPENPIAVGTYSTEYVHDGFVRGDTMWTSEIYKGQFAVVDVSDKANPVLLATQETPGRVTHNCWLSDNGKVLFTTDETSSGFVTAYDVSDLNNITELDRYQADPGTGLIPHNTHFLNNYLVTSQYRYGVNIVDATRPENLVEVGHYDTSPYESANGFNGCWGTYPFLPSGTILASDIETGLYVLTPTFHRACYLEGNVTYEGNGSPVKNVNVEIMATATFSFTDVFGAYKTGVADSGKYDVRFSKEGCFSKIIIGTELKPGLVTTLNTTVKCTTFVGISPSVYDQQPILQISPNIFSDQTNIYYQFPENGNSGSNYVKIFNLNGQVEHTIPLNSSHGEIQLGRELSKGLHIVRLVNGRSVITVKMVKN